MIIAVPVSWQVGRMPFAAISELRRNLQGNVLIVLTGFRVAQDISNLLLMRRTEHKGSIMEGLLRQQRQRLRVNFEDLLPFKLRDRNVIAG
ncbi:hypothetical protein HR12_28665 [Microbacterium sp. SUBG005]|nr:hypothetical protein HR12_28665 [Microbacterium sp. SUBG005]